MTSRPKHKAGLFVLKDQKKSHLESSMLRIYPIFKALEILKTAPRMKITFNELRRIKDSLPDGSIHKIADELEVNVETVRNYFGGYNYRKGQSAGVHIEEGPDGGIVELDDTAILDRARQILEGHQMANQNN